MCVSGGEVKKKKNQAKNKIVVFTVYFFCFIECARGLITDTLSSRAVRYIVVYISKHL